MNALTRWTPETFADEITASGPSKRRGSPERSVQITLKRYLELVLPGCVVAAVKNEHAAKGATAGTRDVLDQLVQLERG